MDRKKENALQCLVCAIVACARSSLEIGRKRYGDLQTEGREEEEEEKKKTKKKSKTLTKKRAEDEENEGRVERGGRKGGGGLFP